MLQAGWLAVCLCLQMDRAAVTKGQQNVGRTRPYRGWSHVPETSCKYTHMELNTLVWGFFTHIQRKLYWY